MHIVLFILSIIGILALGIVAWFADKKRNEANNKLNEIYRMRYERENRRRKLIAEKPDDVIFVSEIPKATLKYTGFFDSNRHYEDWDIITKNNGLFDLEYLYKEGKWYEIVNDVIHLRDLCY